MGGDNLVYVFAAYTIIWLVSFGYLYTINSRQRRLQREIDALKGAVPAEHGVIENTGVLVQQRHEHY